MNPGDHAVKAQTSGDYHDVEKTTRITLGPKGEVGDPECLSWTRICLWEVKRK